MVKYVYFDSNVYDHIYKEVNFPDLYKGINISEKDYLALKTAIESNKISLLLSPLNFEEIIALLNSDQKMGVEQLRLVLSLINPYRIIKAHPDIIKDDILSFAKSGISSSSFILKRNYIWNFESLLRPGAKYHPACPG